MSTVNFSGPILIDAGFLPVEFPVLTGASSRRIWKHLVKLTREEGVAVLVTTHHMDEVREANLIGLMRSGRMLAQDAPDQLLRQNNCDNLAKVFLRLCVAFSHPPNRIPRD